METLKLGRLAPKYDSRTLKLATYLPVEVPPPPPTLDLTTLAPWQMYANDKHSDCTIASLGNQIALWNALSLVHSAPTEAEVLALYFQLSGGADDGLAMLDVLKEWQQAGLSGEHIFAFAMLDHLAHDKVQASLALFGGVYVGANLPLTAQTPGEWGVISTVGDAAPGTWGGHCLLVAGYAPDGVTFITWGRTQRATWAWWDAYIEEAYCCLPSEWSAIKAPTLNGFNFAQLRDDLAAVGALHA